ncbi:MAG TPA: 30S ribosome-binding factor RbfA [Gammaproteobacteria bacterium]|jgi:ribosome-binding factor A|nr:30S ribosome-binding factor RbfA [Gammaproteobacteria bacterium]|tara:strand:- start:61 stop:381 length:321 start_codon:yes stop_codon:yes gene_type:complete
MRSSDFTRSDRLSDQIRTEVSLILRNDVKDPRLEGITIINVELSKDISKAYISFSPSNSFTERNLLEVEEALKKAKGFIRSALGKKLNIKRLPELSFQKDRSYSTL